jgi:hypothetical protein
LIAIQAGLRGCGIRIAYGVSRYGLGDTLLNAARHHSGEELTEFLVEWREELVSVLRHDPKKLIGRKNNVVADAVTDAFPNREVLQLYANPITSWTHPRSGAALIPAVTFDLPDLKKLASFCYLRFGWSGSDVHEYFESKIWEGVCMAMLCQVIIFTAQLHLCRCSLTRHPDSTPVRKSARCCHPENHHCGWTKRQDVSHENRLQGAHICC